MSFHLRPDLTYFAVCLICRDSFLNMTSGRFNDVFNCLDEEEEFFAGFLVLKKLPKLDKNAKGELNKKGFVM